MVKKFSAIFIAVCVVFTMLAGFSVSATDEFQITYSVDYDKSIIHYDITTPARYRQIITVALSKGDNASDVVRAEYVHADIKGKATGSLQMTDNDASGTYTIFASGAGYLENVSKDSTEVYFETNAEVYGDGGTLDKFNEANASGLGALFEAKKAMFNYDFEEGSDYAENSAMLHEMFVAIRTVDYDGEYETFSEVQDTMTAISTIREITFATSADSTRALCEKSAALLGIDTEHEDYKGYESAIYKVLLSLFNEEAPQTITTMKKYIQQSIAIAKLNRVNAAEATDVVRTYGEILGIDVDEYEEYISEYDEIKFNYAFVGMNYTTATQVIRGYEERKLNPPAKAQKPTDGAGSGGGGGGGGGGGLGGGSLGGSSSSSTDPKTPYDSITVEDIKEDVPTEESKTLTDVADSHWAYLYVKELSGAGVINGFEDGSFRPEDTVTREQFVKMLVAAFEMKGEADINYTDVPKDAWYYEAVAIATANDITKGYGDSFGVGSSITREDASVMVYRIINAEAGNADAFGDDSAISSYAKDAVYALSSAGVLNGMGDGSFAPKASLTRAQAAKIIYTALKYNLTK